MSVWDISGAIVWSVLAVIFGLVALMPNKPPRPRYGGDEVVWFFIALPTTAAAVFCIARLCGAHA